MRGGIHTAKPQFIMSGKNVFATAHNADFVKGKASIQNPVFTVAGDKMYKTAFHPSGASPHAMYEIRGDKIHTTLQNPLHNPTTHVFELHSQLK